MNRVAQPLRQLELIDVTGWEQDAEFGIFPQGARAKDAVFSPAEPHEAVITPCKRYLFKRSKGCYPDQFWGEVIAYRIGALMGLLVPPAFVAWKENTRQCAALIEWFYVDGEEVSCLAGDLLQKMEPDFDRARGTTHNLRQNSTLLRAFTQAGILEENSWRQWWADALLFDALIGNTDRHQDNWGFLFRTRGDRLPRGQLMPLFDNGTSLGHERFVEKTAAWREPDFIRYVAKGMHHVSWSPEHPELKGHKDLLHRVLTEWQGTQAVARSRLELVTSDSLLDVLHDLVDIPAPVPLSHERFAFIMKLLDIRLATLKEIL